MRVKGVKFIMYSAHDLDTCYVMNGWVGVRAATQTLSYEF